MANTPLSDEILHETIAAVKQHGTHQRAAAALKVSIRTIAHRLNIAAKRGFYTQQPCPPGFAVSRTTTLYKQGEEVMQWVQAKPDGTDVFIDAIKEVFDEYKGRATLVLRPKEVSKSLLSVYPIADQHMGLLAWKKETGESYDLEIGAERLRLCARDLISQSPPSAQAIILNLGDYQHNDDGRNATPANGNALDVDGRYFKVLTVGIQVMQDVIELALNKHKQVLVRNLPGNHDPHASIALTVALAAFYSKEPRVTISQDPSEFFFHRFGQTLIGANHGHRIKPADMAMCMAAQCREDWGRTRYKQFFYGHFHHERGREYGGVRTECFQSLAAKDAWSHSMGFNAGQSLVGLTLHEERGEIGRHRVNL